MRVHGASIYDTRAGPLMPRPLDITTQKQDTVFVHLLNGADVVLSSPLLPRPVLRASLLDGGALVTITLPRRDVLTADQVVVLALGR